jgi:hypothetical protein
MNLPIQVRIIRDIERRDGWIGRTVPSDRVTYIRNLSAKLTYLEPGQLWSAEITKSLPHADIVELTSLDQE